MPSTRAILIGLGILASNIGIASAGKFTLYHFQDPGRCAVNIENVCDCNGGGYIGEGVPCSEQTGIQSGGVCGREVEVNFEKPDFHVTFKGDGCTAGCNLGGQTDGTSCST